MDFIKRFFGLPRSNQQFNDDYFHHDENEGFRTPESPNEDGHRRSFHIFSDPLRMHQYFEHQMNEMLKMFGFQGIDDGFFSEYNVPALEERNYNDKKSPGELRDQFLKNGYETPPQKHMDKVDKDIDGKVNLGDFDSVFGRKDSSSIYEKNKSDGIFFGQSKSIKTIRNPDGSVETHRTERDSEGNEEKTICRKIGDKEYCIIKKKDKHGKEEIIENFVNMDESEKDKFMKPNTNSPTIEDKQRQNNFSFDIFFK